jgi:hypothetical protein
MMERSPSETTRRWCRPFNEAQEAARRQEAGRLTRLLEDHPGFTYLRMGDGELNWMLRQIYGDAPWRDRHFYRENRDRDFGAVYSVTGLYPGQFERLRAAYRECGYLDKYDLLPFNAERLGDAGIMEYRLRPGQTTNPTPDTSLIFYDWVWHEFAPYLGRHRCLVAGAEAGLFRAFLGDDEFPRLHGVPWPEPSRVVCSVPPELGRNYARHLDDYKKELVALVRKENIHTLFLSLASAAKILAVELARETGVRAFDMGSALRGLCGAAMPGYHQFGSQHHPYFFDVPLRIFDRALVRSQPGISMAERVVRCQAQVAQTLRPRVVAWSLPWDADAENDGQAARRFRKEAAVYRRQIVLPLLYRVDLWKLFWRFERKFWQRTLPRVAGWFATVRRGAGAMGVAR